LNGIARLFDATRETDMANTPDNPGYVDSKTLTRLAALTHRLKQRSLEILNIKFGDCVLDLGCGSGIDTITLAQLVGPDGLVVGVDFDDELLREAEKMAQHAGYTEWIKHLIADARSLPCRASCFDASRSDRLFQHVPNASAVLAEMVRVTKPGGRIVVTDADWGTLSIDTPERKIERKICRALPDLLPNGYMGRELFRLFREHPLTSLEVEVHPIVWKDYETFRRTSLSLPEVDRRLVASGAVSWTEWQRFQNSLEVASRHGCFFASGNMILVAGIRS
jgi:ubiquinone/menaquinone biosynthesis C-methylase UbiE